MLLGRKTTIHQQSVEYDDDSACIGGAQASPVEGREIEFWPNQINDLQN